MQKHVDQVYHSQGAVSFSSGRNTTARKSVLAVLMNYVLVIDKNRKITISCFSKKKNKTQFCILFKHKKVSLFTVFILTFIFTLRQP